MNAPIRFDTKLLDAALAAIRRDHALFIDGKLVNSADGRVLERISPAHGVLVTRCQQAGIAETEMAIAAARAAFDSGVWSRIKGADRAAVLLKVADMIEANAEEIALLDCLEAGKPIAQARVEIAGSADIWRYAAALARDLHGESYNTLGEAALGVVVREPVGVVSIITPWNFPFLIVAQKLPFALAAGCTCVVKPSEFTSASTLVLGEMLAKAGLPAGVVNIIAGLGSEIGPMMTSDARVDMVSFTGSTIVGKGAVRASADTLKKVSMELGGKNPQVIFADCDWDAAIDAVLFGAFFNAGECCNAGSRILVQKSMAAEFVAKLVARSRDVTVGDPLDENTRVGAMITAKHQSQVQNHITQAVKDGAKIACGGTAPAMATGMFLEPTILTELRPEMAVALEEVFGPVLSVLTFETHEEAIALANSTIYGLSASVWSMNVDTCLQIARHVHAGTVWINTFMDGFSELPFGGYKQSGLGRELGRHSVKDYTEEKTIHFHSEARTSWWMPQKR
ncbi:MAG: aldehyde dehydrogenase family protein [Hyphomicrobiales bacterium]|nr:aldehyde dehydrogenase family protein [Hyphomicrobiales bacterium]MDE2113558.1 aldehyde dehydrogenase family protein [Hyphomicrobiales bacterium]